MVSNIHAFRNLPTFSRAFPRRATEREKFVEGCSYSLSPFYG